MSSDKPDNAANIYDALSSIFKTSMLAIIVVYDTTIGSNIGIAERAYMADNGTIAIQNLCIVANNLNVITYYFYANGGYQRTIDAYSLTKQ